ncbi:Non-receptor tyrosine-protein kinase TYK2 [Bagarius yarrelli]|uniref:Non-receptor tyrosine-protein kinase TYK2 n=1 Tax=Bagarius yarrelli TaxID=175774 RepID=A0A556VU80_BAGYA|nr:Non-receptor tyrosine-protein kinase TYK2 [Bagarius yarrelli]
MVDSDRWQLEVSVSGNNVETRCQSELRMSRRGCFKSTKQGASTEQCAAPQGPGIHVYLFWTKAGDCYLTHQDGEVTAEELSIQAAEVVGITPVCFVLFALYDPSCSCWYSPNHTFDPKEQTRLILHFRMRFYFRNWHGLSDTDPVVSRYLSQTGSEQGAAPLLQIPSLEYLFAQAKFDFVNDVISLGDVTGDAAVTGFKNESLGMAVLHLSHKALQTGTSLQEVATHTSFLRCIPRSFSHHIARDNFLTKLRIQRVFADFVRSFQKHTVGQGRLGSQEIMYKYLSTLERLAPRFGTENFSIFHLDLRPDGDGSGSYLNPSRAHEPLEENPCSQPTHELMVSGTAGIRWRKIPAQRAQENNYMGNDYFNKKKRENQEVMQGENYMAESWNVFCDFPEISHIAITGANVCISRQDNFAMELRLKSILEARSLVSLLDGYFRLTADAHHYLCHEVAPPRVVLSEANGLHGPILDEFVVQKLKKEHVEDGAYLLRWSVLDYRRIILAVLSRNEDGQSPAHKQFRIMQKDSVFTLEGWEREFSNVKELMESLKNFVLKSGQDCFTVRKCCLPQPAGDECGRVWESVGECGRVCGREKEREKDWCCVCVCVCVCVVCVVLVCVWCGVRKRVRV